MDDFVAISAKRIHFSSADQSTCGLNHTDRCCSDESSVCPTRAYALLTGVSSLQPLLGPSRVRSGPLLAALPSSSQATCRCARPNHSTGSICTVAPPSRSASGRTSSIRASGATGAAAFGVSSVLAGVGPQNSAIASPLAQ